MRKLWVVAGAAVVMATTGGVAAMSNGKHAIPAAPAPPANTVKVERGKLSAMVSANGTLTYRARADGSPYTAINQARGTYTWLPQVGDKVGCGDVLSRVDDQPVLLLCGTVPAYRDLHSGDVGEDVRQLNANLHNLGDDTTVGLAPDDNGFTWKTRRALEVLQRGKGLAVTGAVAISAAVFLPEPVRIARVTGELGGPAQPGARFVDATSDRPEVQVDLAPSQQSAMKDGDRARIALPGNRSVTGTVDRLGRVAQVPAGKDDIPGAATIPAYISLDDAATVRALDKAPVQVEVTTEGVESALSVAVTAIVGRSGGGFAVEVVRADGRRELIAVKVGLFDTTAGRVEVEGGVREGDQVVVPSP